MWAALRLFHPRLVSFSARVLSIEIARRSLALEPKMIFWVSHLLEDDSVLSYSEDYLASF